MKKIITIFKSKWLVWTLLAVFVQQILVAAGTYLVGKSLANLPKK